MVEEVYTKLFISLVYIMPTPVPPHLLHTSPEPPANSVAIQSFHKPITHHPPKHTDSLRPTMATTNFVLSGLNTADRLHARKIARLEVLEVAQAVVTPTKFVCHGLISTLRIEVRGEGLMFTTNNFAVDKYGNRMRLVKQVSVAERISAEPVEKTPKVFSAMHQEAEATAAEKVVTADGNTSSTDFADSARKIKKKRTARMKLIVDELDVLKLERRRELEVLEREVWW